MEKFAGISGNNDGIDALPDGEFLPPHEMNCVEDYFSQKVSQKYGGKRQVIMGRCAHLTKPNQIHYDQGRAQCQNRAICERGCPYGGYFSSNASTLPWAMKTGKMTLKADSIVHSIIYDDGKHYLHIPLELEGVISLADVIDPTKLSGTVKFGATVRLVVKESDEEKTYQIVGE